MARLRAVPSFEDLIAQLPEGISQHPLAGPPPGISYVDQDDPRWVAPSLDPLPRRSIEDATAQVLLVSAPAAVGKSMFARALANRTGGVLWDLAAFQIGSSFLAGTIGAAHGFNETGEIISAIGRGEFFIVMDALDEAVVKAGAANLEAFVQDLGKVLSDIAPRKPVVALLARAETAEITDLLLDEMGCIPAHYKIEYFDRDQAEEFLDRRLDQREQPYHRIHREPYERARDLLFSKVFAALGLDEGDWSELEARGFLGYAPVLEALAEYLDQPNYVALSNEIEEYFSAAGDQNIWRFLASVLEGVLDREQGKLRDNLPTSVRTGLEQAGVLNDVYSPGEQRRRLVARALDQPQPEVSMPAGLRQEYEEAVRQILGEHPFVGAQQQRFANVVFRDYVLARTLTEGADLEQQAVRALVANPEFRPSPVLARFMLELACPAEGSPVFAAADFPVLYESMRAEDTAGESIGVSVSELDRELLVQVVSPTTGHLDLIMKVDEGAALEVPRRLARILQ
jgi:hypothetical protein